MRRYLLLAGGLAAAVALFSVPVDCMDQSTDRGDGPQTGVVLKKLSTPVYPPIARQAHIAGDEEVLLGIRQDGSIESAVVVSGHPLLVLRQAALESAQHSQFECPGCTAAVTPYRLMFSFQLRAADPCPETESNSEKKQAAQPQPQVIQVQNHVTVIEKPMMICDPAVERRKVRSLKCLYLWRCGVQEVVLP